MTDRNQSPRRDYPVFRRFADTQPCGRLLLLPVSRLVRPNRAKQFASCGRSNAKQAATSGELFADRGRTRCEYGLQGNPLSSATRARQARNTLNERAADTASAAGTASTDAGKWPPGRVDTQNPGLAEKNLSPDRGFVTAEQAKHTFSRAAQAGEAHDHA